MSKLLFIPECKDRMNVSIIHCTVCTQHHKTSSFVHLSLKEAEEAYAQLGRELAQMRHWQRMHEAEDAGIHFTHDGTELRVERSNVVGMAGRPADGADSRLE